MNTTHKGFIIGLISSTLPILISGILYLSNVEKRLSLLEQETHDLQVASEQITDQMGARLDRMQDKIDNIYNLMIDKRKLNYAN